MRSVLCLLCALVAGVPASDLPTYEVSPIGWIRKADGKTTIEIAKQHQPAVLGLDQFDSMWVLYWIDRNDSPAGRSVLQVHPRADPGNPIRGVFATRSPFRPVNRT